MNYIPLFFLLFCHRCSIYRHSAHLRLRRRPSGGAASTPWHPALHRRLPLLLPSPQLQEPQQSRHPLLRLDRVLKVCKSLPVNPLPDREKSDILIFWHFDIWITTIFTYCYESNKASTAMYEIACHWQYKIFDCRLPQMTSQTYQMPL